MPKVYFYKLTVDDGGAPCVEHESLSLALCKPMIRSTAAVDDLILGFAANCLHTDNRLLYVARVNDKLTDGEYFKAPKYAGRSDCIYEWKAGAFAPRHGAKYHGSSTDLVHDLGEHPKYARASTLLSWEFCYFGSSGSDAYKSAFAGIAKAVAALKQGHRVHHDPKLMADLGRLAKWSCSLDGVCIQGKPTSKPNRHASHRGGGCGVAEPKCNC